MKLNAFTLVELLAVITILGIIAVITVPTIQNIISDSKKDACEEQVEAIESAAQRYVADQLDDINYSIESQVSINTLKNGGYLSKSIKDPRNNNEMTGYVTITKSGNSYSYTYDYECGE